MAKKLVRVQYVKGRRAGEVADVGAKEATRALAAGEAKSLEPPPARVSRSVGGD